MLMGILASLVRALRGLNPRFARSFHLLAAPCRLLASLCGDPERSPDRESDGKGQHRAGPNRDQDFENHQFGVTGARGVCR